MKRLRLTFWLALTLAATWIPGGRAQQEVAMFGNTPSRNMVSPEKGLPATWDLKTGKNVKWSTTVGSQAYGGPVVANGRVFVGTNNEGLRDPKIKGDKGVVMAFDANTGQYLWQIVHDKLSAGRVNDWPLQGICSTPSVEGDRVYYVSNRATVVCANAADGKIRWQYDMIGELDIFPHNLAVSSPLIVDDTLYITTSNGVDEGHVNIPSPAAPNFLAVSKDTGALVWEQNYASEKILHGHWTNFTYGVINGKPQLIVAGPDGWLYSLEPKTGEVIWKFDCNPKDAVYILGGRGTRNEILATPVIYDNKVYVGVGQDPEHGEAPGHFWAIDATGSGDVTSTHLVWHRGGEEFYRTISTAAIKDGIAYIANLSGFLYAVDARTGELFWTYDTLAAVWGSPFVVDGKLYLGDEDGDVVILREGKKLEKLAEINMGSSVYTTPVAYKGALYILSRNRLFALQEGASSRPGAGQD